MSSKKICRVCLKLGKMKNIFNKCSKGENIASLYMSFTKINIFHNDGLPSYICFVCLDKLYTCLDFIKVCKESDSKLRNEIISPKIFPEVFEHSLSCYVIKDDEKSDTSDESKELMIDESTQHSSFDHIKLSFESNDASCDRIIKMSSRKEQCSICGKVMSSRYRLKTHLRTHTGERPFPCPHCRKNFSLAQNLKVHLRVHTGEKPLQCSECGKSFAHTAGLATHRRKHTGQLPYACTLCLLKFRTYGHLQYHIRKHTGEKNFECDMCSKCFITRSDLKQHLITHSGEKKHACAVCGLKLSRAAHLRRHVEKIHNNKKHVDEER